MKNRRERIHVVSLVNCCSGASEGHNGSYRSLMRLDAKGEEVPSGSKTSSSTAGTCTLGVSEVHGSSDKENAQCNTLSSCLILLLQVVSSTESKSKPHHHHHFPAGRSRNTDAIGSQMEREKDEKQPLPRPLLPDTSSALAVPSQNPPKSPKPQSRNLMLESVCHAMSVYGSPESQHPSKATASGHTPTSGPDQLAISGRTEIEATTCRDNEVKDLSRAEKTTETAAGISGSVNIDPRLLAEGANEFERERLCIKVGEALGEDRTLVTIWEMGDIEHNDAAMIVRVKDLVWSLPSPNESHCTD